MKNLGNLLKQAQDMQTRMAEMQEQLSQTEVTGTAGGGMVRITLNGNFSPPSRQIWKTFLSQLGSVIP